MKESKPISSYGTIFIKASPSKKDSIPLFIRGFFLKDIGGTWSKRMTYMVCKIRAYRPKSGL